MPNATNCVDPMELINERTDGGLPLFPLLKHNNLYEVMEDLFDKWTTYDPNNPEYAYPDLMLKEFPFRIEHKLLNDCCQVEWYEQVVDEVLATTTTDDISGDTIDISDLQDYNQLRGPSVGSQLFFVDQTTGVTYIRTITDITGSTITIDSAVTVPEGTVVSRGPKYAVIGDCEEGLDDFFTKPKTAPKVSNFARIVYSVKFKRCDLNKDRLIYNYGYDTDRWIRDELVTPAQGFRNLFVKSLMYGNNSSGSNNYGTVTTGSQTMGFITDIWKAQKSVNPTNDPNGTIFVHDFSGCCQAVDSDCEILESFEDQVIDQVLASGAYVNGEPMTAWMNQAQLKEIKKFGPAIQDVFGQQTIMVTELDPTEEGIYYNRFRLQSFQIGSTKFEYKFSRILNELFPNIPVMLIFPAHYVAFYQYMIDGVDENLRARVNQDRSPRLEFVDASPLAWMKSGSKDCYYYRMNLTYSLLLANLCSGAYAFVLNLMTKSSCEKELCGGTLDVVDTIAPNICDEGGNPHIDPEDKLGCATCGNNGDDDDDDPSGP